MYSTMIVTDFADRRFGKQFCIILSIIF